MRDVVSPDTHSEPFLQLTEQFSELTSPASDTYVPTDNIQSGNDQCLCNYLKGPRFLWEE